MPVIADATSDILDESRQAGLPACINTHRRSAPAHPVMPPTGRTRSIRIAARHGWVILAAAGPTCCGGQPAIYYCPG